VAYVSAMVSYFVVNKLVVFRKKTSASVYRELVEFVPLAVVNYVLTMIIVAIIHRYTHEVYSGSVVAGVVTTALTYLVFARFLFKKRAF
jgi:putative flippase GtrA